MLSSFSAAMTEEKEIETVTYRDSCTLCRKRSLKEEKGKSFRCAKCRLVVYCSKKCQVEHWTTHKKDCADLAVVHRDMYALKALIVESKSLRAMLGERYEMCLNTLSTCDDRCMKKIDGKAVPYTAEEKEKLKQEKKLPKEFRMTCTIQFSGTPKAGYLSMLKQVRKWGWNWNIPSQVDPATDLIHFAIHTEVVHKQVIEVPGDKEPEQGGIPVTLYYSHWLTSLEGQACFWLPHFRFATRRGARKEMDAEIAKAEK